jgi:threonylcarbamoyladenosine tRNA methylthiotransferase MtaB
MKTIAVVTLGCKTNQYETEAILSRFFQAGYTICDIDHNPDIILINTCTVTKRADYKSRYLVRKALRLGNPNAITIVTGCYVNSDPHFFSSLNGNVISVPNEEKHRIFELLQENKKVEAPSKKQAHYVDFNPDEFHLHTRVPIKVQEGCDCFCAYCILPYTRGKPRSRDPKSIIDQVNSLTKAGVKEIVLTGINLGLYGQDFKHYSLSRLIEEISSKTDILRIRLSSIEPMFFLNNSFAGGIDTELIHSLASNEKVCPHFHIPLQSGADTVLSRMNRPYTTKQFSSVISYIKSEIPDAAIGCDVIVGFPDETEKEFTCTETFIENLPISYLHIFPFSPRPHTAAYRMLGRPHGKVVKKRVQELITIGQEKKKDYLEFLIRDRWPLQTVFENCINGLWTGVSDHYARVYLQDNDIKKGNLKKVIAQKIDVDKNGIIVKLYK